MKDATAASVTVFLLSFRVTARLLRMVADLLDDLARLGNEARGRMTTDEPNKGAKR